MTTYTNSFFGIPETDTRFNLAAAVDAYEWVLEHPEEARFVVSKALYDFVPKDIEYHAPIIEKTVNSFISKRIEDAKRGISRALISKSENGEDTTSTGAAVLAIDAISKAYTTAERQANVRLQTRDKSGQFTVMNRKIRNDRIPQEIPQHLVHGESIPQAQMAPEQSRKFQNDYAAVRDLLQEAMANTDPAIQQRLMAEIKYSDGTKAVLPLNAADTEAADFMNANSGLVQANDYYNPRAERRAAQLTVYDTATNTAGPSFDALSGMTNQKFADHAIGTAQWASQNHADIVGGLVGTQGDDFRTSDQFWRRMGTASQIAAQVGAPYLPPAATFALQAGRWVGDLAPEAEKVIGPTARRAAYRYRGTEKKPDEAYQENINRLRSMFEGKENAGRLAHKAMLTGYKPGTPEYQPSPVIRLFNNILPNAQRYTLNRMSGNIPPSQGIIIDRKGQVVSEAVGYGEDWYLPFNLKNLSKLDGGEYIRTRAFGGPTTEDVYAGLVSGARAVTVVSHSGVFTIEFDDTFRGGRRYNDKAGRMQERYGQLLDAIKSRSVSLGKIPEDRREEIAALAASEYNPVTDTDDYNRRVRELEAAERQAPKLSEKQQEAIRLRILNDYANENGQPNWEAFLHKAGKADPAKAANWAESSTAAIGDLGLERDFHKEFLQEQAVLQEDIKPLDINGRGYYQALLGLKDQFPYYISEIHYAPAIGTANISGKDYGYVKPRFNRPEGALAGYFDPSITGHGKITADNTNYQNVGVMSRPPFTVPPANNGEYGSLRALREDNARRPFEVFSADENAPAPAPPAGARNPNPVRSPMADVDDLVDQIEFLRAQTHFSTGIPANNPNAAWAGRAIDWPTIVQGQPDWTFGTDPNVVANLYTSGPNSDFFRATRDAVRAAITSGYFNPMPPRAATVYGRQPVPNEPNVILGIIGSIQGGTDYDFPEVPSGRDNRYYNTKLNELLGRTPEIRRNGISVASTDDEIQAAVNARATELRGLLRAHNAGQAPPNFDPAQTQQEALALARVAQAARLRKSTQPDPAVVSAMGLQGAPPPFVSAPSEGAAPVETLAEEPDEETLREERVRDIQKSIHKMVGMQPVAQQVDHLINEVKFRKRREDAGLKVHDSTRHLVFLGNAGTGKTTIAEKLAPIYYELGLIPRNEFYAPPRSELISDHVGGTAKNIEAAFEKAKGGVLFIDEAYALNGGKNDPYGQEAITAILVNAEKHRADTVVILAGYPEETEAMLRSNQGLNSRFPTKIRFPDYSPKAMSEIYTQYALDGDFDLGRGTGPLIRQATEQFASSPQSGNVRDVRNLMDKTREAVSARTAAMENPSIEDLRQIKAEDIRYAMTAMGVPPKRKPKYQ